MEKFFVELPVRLIPHGKIQPGFLVHDALVVGKGPETFSAMVGAHSALSEAAESHFAGGKVNDRIVDASAAESAERHDSAGGASVLGEEIKRQRVLHGVDLSDRLIQSIKGYDGEKRTEDFFLHNGIIESRRRK